MGCCNGKKTDSAELDLQMLDLHSRKLLNNDGVDDLILTGASGRLHAEKHHFSSKKGIISLEKTEETVGQLVINTPTFAQFEEPFRPFRFEEQGNELKEVTEEQTFGGSPDQSPRLT